MADKVWQAVSVYIFFKGAFDRGNLITGNVVVDFDGGCVNISGVKGSTAKDGYGG